MGANRVRRGHCRKVNVSCISAYYQRTARYYQGNPVPLSGEPFARGLVWFGPMGATWGWKAGAGEPGD